VKTSGNTADASRKRTRQYEKLAKKGKKRSFEAVMSTDVQRSGRCLLFIASRAAGRRKELECAEH